MDIIKFDTGDVLIMKKKHPCGGDSFKVLRTGSDIRVECTLCKRDMIIPREKIEKNIKAVRHED